LSVAIVLAETRILANERIRTLGGDSLGESLKEFQTRYPKAICGSPAKAKHANLTDAEITSKVFCYLDDRDSLAKISSAPFLNLSVRAVWAIFWKGRLYNLSFDLSVGSIRTVLDSFEKTYGPPTLIAMDDPADAKKMTHVFWLKGDTRLQVRLSHPGEEVGQMDSTRPEGQPSVEIVCVDLLSAEIGTSRN